MSGILVATHGGTGVEGAVRVAAQLSTRLRVALHAVAVLEPTPVYDYGYGALWGESPETDDVLSDEVQASVRAQLQACGVDPTLGSVEFEIGAPALQIEHVAERLHADLIVTGTGPHDLLHRALGGETALELAQSTTIPLLAVPADARRLPRRVIAAVDFTPTSIRAAETVARWLVAGDELNLVHVRPRGHVIARQSASPSDADSNATSDWHLHQLAATVGIPAGVALETAVLDGDPAKALLHHAEEIRADLIAVGSHGYGAWKRLALGSVASKIIRQSKRSVLVIPMGSVLHQT